MSFITLADLLGYPNITQSKYQKTDYDSIIAEVEETILKQLLGDDLYLKFTADLLTSSPSDIYTRLRDGYQYQVENKDGVNVYVDFKGIKPMLKYFIHSELIKYQDSQNSDVGQVEPSQINSQRLSKANLNKIISQSYNKAINLYGKDIETYFNSGCGCSAVSITKLSDTYWSDLVKGNCFNFLYKYKVDYPTWQFTEKNLMLFNGYL